MIGRRFVAYFALLAIVTIVTTVAAEYHFIDQSIEHSVHQNLHFARSVARFVGGMVSEEGEGMEKLLTRLPDELTTTTAADVDKLIAEHQRNHSAQTGYEIYDAQRHMFASRNLPGGVAPAEVLLPALRAAETTGHPMVTDLWRGFDERPRVSLVRARKHESGWRFAVANLRLDGEELQRMFGYFRLNDTARLQLLDSKGIVLYSTNGDERYRSGVHGTYFSDRVRPGQPVQMRCHSCHENGEKEQVRTAEFTTVVPVTGTGWSVLIRESEDTLFGPLHRSAVTHAILFCILFGAFIAFFLLLWRRVMLPMRQLAKAAAAAMQTGESISDLHLRDGDEFAHLQKSLDAATRRRAMQTGKTARVENARLAAATTTGTALLLPTGERDDDALRQAMERSLAGVASGLAKMEGVHCAMISLHGDPLSDCLVVTHGIALADDRKPCALMDCDISDGFLTRQALAEGAMSFDGADEVRGFLVREFKVLEELRVRLWLGTHETTQNQPGSLRPLLSLFTAQVHAVVERTVLFHELQQRHGQKNRLLRHLFDAESRERKRIAREIHDETAQDLTALLLLLETFPGAEDEIVGKRLEAAKSQVSGALEGIDRLIQRLRPAVLDDLGLLEAVRSLGHNWLEPAGIAFEVSIRGSDVELPSEVESTVYRVFQEASTNVIRHSGAKKVEAHLEMLPDRLEAWIRDDGKGMDLAWVRDTERNPRWGLLGMRERILQLGGTIRFETPAEGGLQITFEVPYASGPVDESDMEEQGDGANHPG